MKQETIQVLESVDPADHPDLAVEADKIGCASVAEYITEIMRDAHAESTNQ